MTPPPTVSHKKGGTIQILSAPTAVIPLFIQDEEEDYSKLPQFVAAPAAVLSTTTTAPSSSSSADNDPASLCSLSSLPTPVKEYIRTILLADDKGGDRLLIYIIVVCLHLVFHKDGQERILDHRLVAVLNHSTKDKDKDVDRPQWSSRAPVTQAWKLVKEQIDREKWERLIDAVSRQIHIVWTDHPLHAYASHTVPSLSTAERLQVLETLNIPTNSKSALNAMKKIHDAFLSRPYAVLLDDASFPFQHSCLPSAQLELTYLTTPPPSTGQVTVTARIDIPHDAAPVTVSFIQDDESVEQREDRVQRRTGQSCGCLRCRYEANPQLQLLFLDGAQAKQLGHFYMGMGGFEQARPLYEYAAANKDHKSDLDLWHAQGALELSVGNFLVAQRVWKQALAHSTARSQHEGISLQLTKLDAYGYLREQQAPLPTPPTTPRKPIDDATWTSPVPNAFVTRLLDAATCQRVIAWADSGEWTHQRHYAVPTHDVPVHTVAPLLEWFNGWMLEHVCPLLARQFQTTTNYFVHDAFCVRYQAGKASNHLPVHTDESTHSFVMALNNDYQGGGTYFFDRDKTVRLESGELLSFRGDSLQHGGEAVTKGERYILAVFLYHDDDGNTNDTSQRTQKRPASAMTQLLQESKQQQVGFSFNFSTTL